MKNISFYLKSIGATGAVAVLGGAGLASANSSIGTTGPGSNNVITNDSSISCTVTNSNLIDLMNTMDQSALSGDATSQGNTQAGGASTGDASNSSTNNSTFRISNDAGICALQQMHNNHSASISTTGPNSNNTITSSSDRTVDISNQNSVGITNQSTQNGSTGSANVSGNTSGGSARTGDARNTASSGTHATVSNHTPAHAVGGGSGSGLRSASIHLTGPSSTNMINDSSSSSFTLNNTNDVNVTNNSSQTASSGDANVSGNTTGGSAHTGSAHNSSSVNTSVNISN